MINNLYNLYLKNTWYLVNLDYELVNYLKKKNFKKSKNFKKLKKRLDLFEFPMICILSMYKGI